MKKFTSILAVLFLLTASAFAQKPTVSVNGSVDQTTAVSTSYGTLGSGTLGTPSVPGNGAFAVGETTSYAAFSGTETKNDANMYGFANASGDGFVVSGGHDYDGFAVGAPFINSFAAGSISSGATADVDCLKTVSVAQASGQLEMGTGVQYNATDPMFYGYTNIQASYGASSNSGDYSTAGGSAHGVTSSSLFSTPNANVATANSNSTVTASASGRN
jgi:hypothetical protein